MTDPFAYLRERLTEEQAQKSVAYYRERFAGVLYVWRLRDLCGHNPQLLLTDQRSAVRRFEAVSLAQRRNPSWPFAGGTITGRHPSREPIPIMYPGGEAIMPLRAMTTNPPFDYGQVEARVIRSMQVPRHLIEVKVNSARARAVFEETMMRLVMFGTGGNGRRIDYLRLSPDPRQRKRGNRLADKQFRARMSRYRKD